MFSKNIKFGSPNSKAMRLFSQEIRSYQKATAGPRDPISRASSPGSWQGDTTKTSSLPDCVKPTTSSHVYHAKNQPLKKRACSLDALALLPDTATYCAVFSTLLPSVGHIFKVCWGKLRVIP